MHATSNYNTLFNSEFTKLKFRIGFIFIFIFIMIITEI